MPYGTSKSLYLCAYYHIRCEKLQAQQKKVFYRKHFSVYFGYKKDTTCDYDKLEKMCTTRRNKHEKDYRIICGTWRVMLHLTKGYFTSIDGERETVDFMRSSEYLYINKVLFT